MKNKYKTMIYPYDVESAPLIRHNNLINNYDITHAVSPSGWGLNNKDVGYADSGESLGIIINDNFDMSLESCDAVFFNEPSKDVDLNRMIYPKIIKAAEKSKNIVCTIEIEKRIFDEVSKICNKNGKSFEYFTNRYDKIVVPPTEEIYKIDKPVIFVLGLAEKTNKFEIQLNLRKELKDMGYKVAQLGTRHYCELMGFHSFPKFMYSKSITESQKVTLFNYYIKSISNVENPDVILIGIPGGAMPFNYEFTNKFGILAYEVSQAVLPDVAVLSKLYSNAKLDFFKLISKSFKYKFGYSIDCYNVANLSLNVQASQQVKSLQYITMDYNFINEKKKKYRDLNIPIYNTLDIDDAKKMSEFLINKLQEYGNTKII